ncbi:DoxX family protein [Gracilimonas sp.]|uniref:DoxX family protein n=1 Tax=Gracilimonas sp. TaxID=1974203 RepID=UPI0028724E99|nr:DoxX family protein [Gracilimonas sp.]
MSDSIFFLTVAIAGFFLIYGMQCLRSPFMKEEFHRYGMGDGLRKLTGISQLIGACSLIAGLYFSIVGFLSAAGLCFMMLVAFGTRLRVGDSLNQTLPSFFFMMLNGYLAYKYLLLVLRDL